MKFYSVALVFGAVDQAVSFSYLESLTRGVAPTVTKQIVESPFFFVDVVEEIPAVNLPAPAPVAGDFSYQQEPPSFTSAGTKSYMEALSGATSSSAPSGGGLTSYLDALPQNTVAAVGGSGIMSYAESLNSAGALSSESYSAPVAPPPAAPATPAFPAAPTAPAAPATYATQTAPAAAQSFSFEDPVNIVASSANYLDALASTSSNAPSGGGMRGYLDGLPSAPSSALGGGGITGYLDSLPTVGGISGAGLQSHSDGFTGGASSTDSSSETVTFTMGSVNGKFDFTLEATDEIIQKLKNAGDRRISLNGKITDVYTV